MIVLKHLYYLYLLFLEDLPRIRTLFFVGIGNYLPDTFFFGRIRVYLLIMAGGKVKKPETCIIREGFFTENASNIYLGEHVQINKGCLLSGHAKTVLGDGVILSYDVKLLSISHVGETNTDDVVGEIHLGKNSILYAGTIVKPGVRIGESVIVGAASMVTKSLEGFSSYAGNPAKLITKN